MSPKVQSVKISAELWKFLNTRKEPGDNFEDVIWRLIRRQEQ